MSIDCQSYIRNTCLYRGGEFNVLMAMADCANTADGDGIYPGIDLLAANARQSTRQCQENINRLRNDGVVILVGPDGADLPAAASSTGGRGKRTEYRIDLERVQELQGLHEAERGRCDFCKARLKRVQFAKRNPAVSRTKGAVSATKGEVSRKPYIDSDPSSDPSNEPSPSLRSGDTRAPSLPGFEGQPVKEKPKRGPHLMPEDFTPDLTAAIAYWRRRGREDLVVMAEDEAETCKAHHRKLSSKMSDWPSAWRTWYVQTPERIRPPRQLVNGGQPHRHKVISILEDEGHGPH